MADGQVEYTEVGHLHRQVVSLADAHAIVNGRLTLSGDYNAQFAFHDISTSVIQGRMRDRAFQQYAGALFLTFLVAVSYHAGHEAKILDFWGGLLTFLPTVFILACLVTVRKFRFAAFLNHAGTHLFSVSELGPQRRDFDNFVAELRHRVELSRGSAVGQDDDQSAAQQAVEADGRASS